MTAAAELRLTDLPAPQNVRLFLCGDVMTGRGIDQILPRPCEPQSSTRAMFNRLWNMCALPRKQMVLIPRAVAPSYIWGSALDELKRTPAGCSHHQSRNGHYAE